MSRVMDDISEGCVPSLLTTGLQGRHKLFKLLLTFLFFDYNSTSIKGYKI